MEWQETRSNSSNKGEGVGEPADNLATKWSVYGSLDRASIRLVAAPPTNSRVGSHLDLLTFSGRDTIEWMFHLKFDFRATKIPDQDKISMAIMKFSGEDI